MKDAHTQNTEAWRAVAAGWERHRPLFWDATRGVSQRLVELLDPQPGDTVLDIAAGPGDTGLLALPRLRPGGRLISTDVAPEMVDAARRRAVELGLDDDDVVYAVEDAAELSFADGSMDGVLCRWGLMLVPDMDAAAAEIARVVRPTGHVAAAVWAEPAANDWITAAARAALEVGLIEPPDPDQPGPFRLSEAGRVESLLEGAGLEVKVVEDVTVAWRASSLDEWWEVVNDTSRMLSQLVDRVTEDEAKAVRAGAESRLEWYVQPDGALVAPGLARVVLATRA
jgi:ubiquinone/menaquinone biosynthesis C-methylase UbiE